MGQEKRAHFRMSYVNLSQEPHRFCARNVFVAPRREADGKMFGENRGDMLFIAQRVEKLRTNSAFLLA